VLALIARTSDQAALAGSHLDTALLGVVHRSPMLDMVILPA
jgi:hypothetical protein